MLLVSVLSKVWYLFIIDFCINFDVSEYLGIIYLNYQVFWYPCNFFTWDKHLICHTLVLLYNQLPLYMSPLFITKSIKRFAHICAQDEFLTESLPPFLVPYSWGYLQVPTIKWLCFKFRGNRKYSWALQRKFLRQ